MRVIAGAYKGRVLRAPTWTGLRPSSDRLRETLFNVLAPRIEGARVLDVCAGTGAVGIEALSRGAAAATFVERDRRAAALIAGNLRTCGIDSGYVIDRRDALASAEATFGGGFDIVFLDPPYEQPSLEPWVALGARHVTPGGLIVLEHASRLAAPDVVGTVRRTRQLRQGDSTLTFYAVEPE
ncbi:MAG: 16S rRNA (guanine(966)-N(2))-methyltransferase RsmD [Acidobacteria bacterium]|nr:16S rRNA (guanine(966)-N(2))-methyltransferase RsmD [Acidobacteriota bacterium]